MTLRRRKPPHYRATPGFYGATPEEIDRYWDARISAWKEYEEETKEEEIEREAVDDPTPDAGEGGRSS